MESITIEVAEGRYGSSKEARKNGQIPMVYYAKNIETRHFTTEYQDFRRAFRKAGRSTIITLKDEKGGDYPVLVHQIQYDPVSDDIIHVDLRAIKKGEKIQTEVPLVFIGASKAVREDGGNLNTAKARVHIECLPQNLPHEIEVDISSLVDFHTSLTIADIKVPEGVTILDAKDHVIATVSAPRAEEVETVSTPVVAEPGAEGTGETAESAEKPENSKDVAA